MVRRALILSVAALVLVAASGVMARPAKAVFCTMTLYKYAPILNGNGNPVFKGQMKADCKVQTVTAIACAAYWIGATGDLRDQLSTCDKNTNKDAYQVTATKTLTNGCTHNLQYITKTRGYYTIYEGVTYTIPGGSGFAFEPDYGGVILC